jgi:energy-coupling factor transporter ATP-binding protein EcfA2
MAQDASPKLVRACAILGVTPHVSPRARREVLAGARAGARRLDRELRPGEIALITGPSGGGKSTLLAQLARPVRRRGHRVITVDPCRIVRSGASLIDFLPGSPEEAMRTLARAGLADATILARRPSELSEGQRFRLALALAMSRAGRGAATLLIDEFGSTLDRASGACLARTLARWTRSQSQVRVVCATAHDDLLTPLSPDVVARQPLRAPTELVRRAVTHSRVRFLIERGSITDYDRLARFHYRAGRPATVVRVLRAIAPRGELAGALVVSMPTLNGAWRDRAWPRRFRTACKRADAARLARELRTISRVIIEPRWRGAGLAVRLVRAYLRRPLTPATEAVAAMGACSPFFARAGMTEYRLPPSRRDARLLDALEHLGAAPESLLARAPGLLRSRLLVRELRFWANAAGPTRPLLESPLRALGTSAALALLTPRIAYAHTRRSRT